MKQPCAACGRETAAGSPAFAGRTTRTDAAGTTAFLCPDCAAGPVADQRHDAPITMPNTNLPQSH
ncbi:MAG: hypothetical protein ABI622_02665 [Chloroflexota bacterium]